MTHHKPLLLAILMCASTVASAQVYRTVGPDGQVVYSGTPPAANSASSSTGTDQATDTDTSKPKHHVAKVEAAPAGPVDAATLQKALAGVVGLEDQINQTRTLCVRTLPSAFDKYNDAANTWKDHNATILAQKERILAAYGDQQREALVREARLKNQQTLAKIAGSPAESRISWCDKAAVNMSNGSMDAANNPALSPLLGSK